MPHIGMALQKCKSRFPPEQHIASRKKAYELSVMGHNVRARCLRIFLVGSANTNCS